LDLGQKFWFYNKTCNVLNINELGKYNKALEGLKVGINE